MFPMPRPTLVLLALFPLRLWAVDPVLTVNGTSANYTTTHVFVDEIRDTAFPQLALILTPNEANVTSAEVFTNLNNRDRANADTNSDGIPDGILPPDGATITTASANTYYQVWTMSPGTGGTYTATLPAQKTGAYRLTARWKVSGDSNWHWYSSSGRRDHAVVVSPVAARDLVIYEINTLNIEANGIGFSNRSTLQDLSDRPGAIHTNPTRANNFNLAYLQGLGVNTLWFQPWHPYGWEGRHLSAADINTRAPGSGATTWRWNAGSPYEDTNYPYGLGSPYAVKNFFEVDPRLTADFTGDPANQADVSSATNRAKAMTALQNFAADADAAGIRLMPDAAFNHASADVELGPNGVSLWGGSGNPGGWAAPDRIDSRERRIFSRENDYWLRANLGFNIAPAPDRFDFGKWLDAKDFFFGRYASLWRNSGSADAQKNEADWFDTTSYDYNGSNGGSFDAVTRGVWHYFGSYVPYWLGKTRPAGQNRNSTPSDGDAAARQTWDDRGIDGLRCDFGQGIPPQAWEYIINTARASKWNFVFMAESLDGGEVTYRSNRHFDLLNENMMFSLRSALSSGTQNQDIRSALESRRSAYGQGLLLLNTCSHDEENYQDPWNALMHYAAVASVDGAPMIFPGQELGISKQYGYDLMEKNFGKYIPHFKTFNSMMPIWANSDYGLDQIYPVYAAVNRARAASPALRSSNRYFLGRQSDGSASNTMWSVAKFANRNTSAAVSDTVFAFVNLNRGSANAEVFRLNVDTDTNGQNDFGIRPSRLYNVRNLAAYTALDATRSQTRLFPTARLGSDLIANGLYVGLNATPTTNGAWASAPYEAQYLKLEDVTQPPVGATPTVPAYVVGTTLTPSWTAATDSEGSPFTYRLLVSPASGGAGTFYDANVGSVTSKTLTLPAGQTVYLRLIVVSPAGVEGSASPEVSTQLLDPAADTDHDGLSNLAELNLGLDPLAAADTPAQRPAAQFVTQVAGPLDTDHYLALSYRVRPGFGTVVIEQSTDLITWRTVDPGTGQALVSEVSSTPSGDSEVKVVRSVTSLETNARQFLRIRVDSAP